MSFKQTDEFVFEFMLAVVGFLLIYVLNDLCLLRLADAERTVALPPGKGARRRI